jgi:hypothetical protein
MKSLLLFNLLVLLSLTTSIFGAEPGTTCPLGTECGDATTFMVCNPTSKICECQAFSSWERSDGKCFVDRNNPCTTPTPNGKAPCTPNSVCTGAIGDPTTCQCNSGYSPSGPKKCLKTGGQTCTTHSNCDRDNFQTCVGGKCSCPTNTIYESSQCRVLNGGQCDASVTTGPKVCAGIGETTECKASPAPVVHTCQCLSGFTLSARQCFLKLNDVCSKTNDLCDPSKRLTCEGSGPINGICTCKSGRILNAGKCDRGEGEPCTGAANECMRNSQCVLEVDDGDSDNRVCRCNEGYFKAASDGLCYVKAGGACTATSQCDPDDFQVCDTTTRTCGCANPTKTVLEMSTVLGVNSKCKIRANETCAVDSSIDPLQECTAKAFCDTFDMKCRCFKDNDPKATSHYESTTNGKCVLPYQTKCTTAAPKPDLCDEDAGQSCIDEKCACVEGMQWNEKERICHKKFDQDCEPEGTPCAGGASCLSVNGTDGTASNKCVCDKSLYLVPDKDADDNDVCLSGMHAACNENNATFLECSSAHNLECLESSCQCHPNYMATGVNGTCVGHHGAACSDDTPCRGGAALSCHNGTCGCYQINQEWNYETRQCVSRVGGPCTVGEVKNDDVKLACAPELSCNAEKDWSKPYDGVCAGVGKLVSGGALLSTLIVLLAQH